MTRVSDQSNNTSTFRAFQSAKKDRAMIPVIVGMYLCSLWPKLSADHMCRPQPPPLALACALPLLRSGLLHGH
jgi:hypothetical protein